MKDTPQHDLFTNEEKAIEFWEQKRWPEGPVCPHCGLVGEAYKLQGKSTRPGLWKCKGCRKPFTAKMRSIFEDSHIPMHKWLYAFHLLCSSKKGMSAYQFHRMQRRSTVKKFRIAPLGSCSIRMRFAMTSTSIIDKARLAQSKCDETYVGGKMRLGKTGYKWSAGGRKAKAIIHARASTTKGSGCLCFPTRRSMFSSTPRAARDLRELEADYEEMVDEDAHVMTDSGTVLDGRQGRSSKAR